MDQQQCGVDASWTKNIITKKLSLSMLTIRKSLPQKTKVPRRSSMS